MEAILYGIIDVPGLKQVWVLIQLYQGRGGSIKCYGYRITLLVNTFDDMER